jgi:adenylosuccinate synthase
MSTIVLFSGPIASGKTTLADALIAAHGFQRLKSSDHLRTVCEQRGEKVSRTALQDLGDRLDNETEYRWLVEEVARPQLASGPHQSRWLIDSVRKERQVAHFRAEFGSSILHVHVWAPEEVLRARFEARRDLGKHHEGLTTYDEAIAHPNEISARSLSGVAEFLIDSSQTDPAAAAASILERVSGEV